MTEPIDNTDSSSPLSDKDSTVFKLLVGEKTCTSGFMKFLWRLIYPVLLTVLFGLVWYLQRRKFVSGITENARVSTVLYFAIFFVGALLLDLFLESWRQDNPVCEGS